MDPWTSNTGCLPQRVDLYRLMMNIFWLLLLWIVPIFAGIEDHYRKLENKTAGFGVKNIDYIYMINLDQRPERWLSCKLQLEPYGIYPQRFPGIYGWTIPVSVLTDIGLKFQPGMWPGSEYVLHFEPNGNGERTYIPLNGAAYGKTVFSGWTVIGTIGCTLSHLSVLHDAYTSGYETIWVLEDDIRVVKNPRLLSDLIEELDALVGEEGWDVLYTDYDYLMVDKNRDLHSQIPMMWRPDMPFLNINILAEHHPVGDKFMKIGSRARAHSIIYRRCGIKKILDFYREHNNFLPYDQELALVPGIKTFIVLDTVVSFHEVTSDTRYKNFSP